MSSLAAPLVGCNFLLCGSYAGKQNQTTLTATICDQGGSTCTKLTDSVTHLLISDSEWIKRGAKTCSVLEANENPDKTRIWIITPAWLAETCDTGVRQDENEWDLALNADESEEEYDRLEREEKEANKAERKQRKLEEEKERKDEEEAESGTPKQSTSALEVDEHCSLGDKVKLHKSKRTVWNAYMTQEDGSSHKFYKVQIVKSTTQNMFWVFTRWGRLDTDGKSQTQGPWANEAEAISVFEKKFKEKTKIAWKDRKTELPVDGKYTYLRPEEADEEDFGEFDDADFAELDQIEANFTSQPSQASPVKENGANADELDEVKAVENTPVSLKDKNAQAGQDADGEPESEAVADPVKQEVEEDTSSSEPAVGSQQAAVKVEEFPIDEDAAKPEVPGGDSEAVKRPLDGETALSEQDSPKKPRLEADAA